MRTGVSVREMADRENTDRENTDRESMDRESTAREISSEGTNMGLWNTAGRYAHLLTGSLADRRAC